MSRGIACAALAAALCVAAPGRPTRAAVPQASDYAGVYAIFLAEIQAPDYHVYQAALADPDVDGVTLLVNWTQLYDPASPRPGVYDWPFFDLWVDQAVAHGKKLSIGVIAGFQTPEWLYEPPLPVAAHEFTFNNAPQAATPVCVTRLLPTPWDPGYISAYTQMLADVAQHLRDIGAMRSVRIIKLDGINRETEELTLGATRSVDEACPPPPGADDLTAGWQAAGLTPYNVLYAWRKIAEATAAAFPDQLLSVDVLGADDGFPPIDDRHHIVAPSPDGTDDITGAVVTQTLADHGKPGGGYYGISDRLSVQWDALSAAPELLDPEPLRAVQLGSVLSWQTNDGEGSQGAACLDSQQKNEVCPDAAAYQAILDRGISFGAKFIEIQAIDATLYPSGLTEPHQRLTGG